MKNIDKDLYIVTKASAYGKDKGTKDFSKSYRGTFEEVMELIKVHDDFEYVVNHEETFVDIKENYAFYSYNNDGGDWDDPTILEVWVKKFNFAVKEIYPYKHKDNDSMCFFAKPIEDEQWERVEDFVGIYHDEEFIDTVSKALDAEEELKKLTQE